MTKYRWMTFLKKVNMWRSYFGRKVAHQHAQNMTGLRLALYLSTFKVIYLLGAPLVLTFSRGGHIEVVYGNVSSSTFFIHRGFFGNNVKCLKVSQQ